MSLDNPRLRIERMFQDKGLEGALLTDDLSVT